VAFETQNEAEFAVKHLNGSFYNDKTLLVELSNLDESMT
jgi:hypothetical protein